VKILHPKQNAMVPIHHATSASMLTNNPTSGTLNDVRNDHRPAARDNSKRGIPSVGSNLAAPRSVLRRENTSAALIGIIIRMWLYSELFRARAMVVRQGFHQMATEAAQSVSNARRLGKSILRSADPGRVNAVSGSCFKHDS